MQHFAQSQAWNLVHKCNPPFSAMQRICESRSSIFISLSAIHVVYILQKNDHHNANTHIIFQCLASKQSDYYCYKSNCAKERFSQCCCLFYFTISLKLAEELQLLLSKGIKVMEFEETFLNKRKPVVI